MKEQENNAYINKPKATAARKTFQNEGSRYIPAGESAMQNCLDLAEKNYFKKPCDCSKHFTLNSTFAHQGCATLTIGLGMSFK